LLLCRLKNACMHAGVGRWRYGAVADPSVTRWQWHAGKVLMSDDRSTPSPCQCAMHARRWRRSSSFGSGARLRRMVWAGSLECHSCMHACTGRPAF
jgi:hypothetical protein